MPDIKIALLGATVIGIICTIFAKKKHRNQLGWFAIGFLFGIFGLMILLFMPALKPPIDAAVVTLPPLFTPESPLTEKMWYYLTPEKVQKGPMSYQALEEAFHNSSVTSDTYLWHDELDEWKTLSLIED
jgi:hypothetical protein